mgnify:CR=1 FL=1
MADTVLATKKILATMAVGAGTTGEINLEGYSIVAIETPNALTGGTITFQAATVPGGTFRPVFDSANNQLSAIVGTNQFCVDIPELAPLQHIKLVMGTQAAAANFTLVMK